MSEAPPSVDTLHTIESAAELLGVSVRQVYRLIADPDVALRVYSIQGMSRSRRLKHSELMQLVHEGDR